MSLLGGIGKLAEEFIEPAPLGEVLKSRDDYWVQQLPMLLKKRFAFSQEQPHGSFGASGTARECGVVGLRWTAALLPAARRARDHRRQTQSGPNREGFLETEKEPDIPEPETHTATKSIQQTAPKLQQRPAARKTKKLPRIQGWGRPGASGVPGNLRGLGSSRGSLACCGDPRGGALKEAEL